MKLRNCIAMTCLLAPSLAVANDYPTQARVEYVMRCMAEHGGPTYDTMYGCICSIDKIASQLTYDKYVESETLSVMIKTPGEKGGAFRDAPGGREMVKHFRDLKQSAESACFVARD